MYLCVSVVVVVACRCVYGRNRRGVGGMWWLLMCFGAHACVCVCPGMCERDRCRSDLQ